MIRPLCQQGVFQQPGIGVVHIGKPHNRGSRDDTSGVVVADAIDDLL